MLFDAAVDAAVILVTVPALVMNWRTQRAATMVVASASMTGPMTDRWKSAVEMLAGGPDGEESSVEARLGAVYALEQIARDSDTYKAPAMELLAAYVRVHASKDQAGLEPSIEMQSILTVLGRSGAEGLDLRRTALWGADLEGATLIGANFGQSRLRGASLAGARLPRAKFRASNLTDANLAGADLSGAVLTGASLKGADLTGAVLRGADLTGVDLTRANLQRANLREAVLRGATLTGALLDSADLSGATLDSVDLSGAILGPAVASRDQIWLPMIGRSPRMAPAARSA
jgi:hypothetical protein